MKRHGNATTTLRTRAEIQRLYREEGLSFGKIAKRLGISDATAIRWAKRANVEDHASGRKPGQSPGNDPAYRQAVIQCRAEHPYYGPIRIAQALQADFPFANRGTVLSILQQEKLSRPRGPKKSEQD
jgi:transposase